MMDGRGKSDGPVVPGKPPNNAGQPAAEAAEGRGPAKGNPHERNALRTPSRAGAQSALERVRQAAEKDRRQRFTALLHHVYDVERLRAAYLALKRDAVAGIDGETWQHYGEDLEVNLRDLSGRLKRGAYRAKPVRRAYIPKADGRQRPLGVPTVEDKIVQRAVVEVLNAIYEADFLGFSYGFRPGRSPHQALDALTAGVMTKKVNWVLDADIRGFFDTLDHGWLVRFIEHRVADRRVVRLIQKWLNAGVLEDGKRTRSEVGTVQGGSVSPLLANVYLHYVFDLWVQRGGRSRRGATWSSCVSRMTLPWDSSIGRRPSASWPSYASGSRGSVWSCTPTRRASSSSGGSPTRTGANVAGASRRPSPSWASRTAARRPGRESSRCCGRRCARGGGRSWRR